MMKDVLGVIGISSVVSIVFAFVFDIIKGKLNYRFEKLTIEKEYRYRSALLFMSVIVDYNNYIHIEAGSKPNTDKKDEVIQFYIDEIKLFRDYSYLFASPKVIDEIDIFLDNPSKIQHRNVALAMRKDLWHNKIKKLPVLKE